MKAARVIVVESNMIRVIKVKRFTLDLPVVTEGSAICQKNPYILHAALPKHSCQLEIEEVYMTQDEYALALKRDSGI